MDIELGSYKYFCLSISVTLAASEVGCVQLSEQGDSAVNLCFKVSPVPGKEVVWETILVDNSRLYVEVPHGILPEGSRER